jgi:hypothetical protein
MLTTAADEERVAKSTLAMAAGVGGAPASANVELSNATDAATTALEDLMGNPDCAPFLSSVTPIADVQAEVAAQAATGMNPQQQAAELFQKQTEAAEQKAAVAEAAEKNSAESAKKDAFNSEGAYGVLKENKEKQAALDERAEDRYLEEEKERSAKTFPAMQKIFLAKKADLEKEFQVKLLTIRTHATEEGMQVLLRSKESGDKAAFSPGVRKETRLKMKKKYAEQDAAKRNRDNRRMQRVLQTASCSIEAIKQLNVVKAQQNQHEADRIAAAANDPHMWAKVNGELSLDYASQARKAQLRASQEGKLLPGQIETHSVANPTVLAAIRRFNDAVAGVVSEEAMQQQTPPAEAAAEETDSGNTPANGNSGNNSTNSTVDPEDEDPAGTPAPTFVGQTLAPTSMPTTAPTNPPGWVDWSTDTTNTTDNTTNSSGDFATGWSSHNHTTLHTGTNVTDENYDPANPATAANVSGSISDWSDADDSTIERINGHECKAGSEVQFFNDRCYSFAECAAACEEMQSCLMFETNGCECKFYDAKANPVSASGWTCGIKHLNDHTSSSTEVQLMESQPDVHVALGHANVHQSGVQTLDLHLQPSFNPLYPRPQS